MDRLTANGSAEGAISRDQFIEYVTPVVLPFLDNMILLMMKTLLGENSDGGSERAGLLMAVVDDAKRVIRADDAAILTNILLAVFDFFDTDSSGSLSMSEVQHMGELFKFDGESMELEDRIRSAIGIVDSDGDGLISKAEFKTMLTRLAKVVEVVLRCACPSRCCPSKAAAVVYRSARLTARRKRKPAASDIQNPTLGTQQPTNLAWAAEKEELTAQNNWAVASLLICYSLPAVSL